MLRLPFETLLSMTLLHGLGVFALPEGAAADHDVPHLHQPAAVLHRAGLPHHRGSGVIEKEQSTDVESPHPPPRVSMGIYLEGKSCSDCRSRRYQ